MATEHVDIQSANAHEPRGITNASTADAGKVITPSAVTAGTSEIRALVLGEYDFVITHTMPDINTATVDYRVVPVDCTLVEVKLITNGATSITTDTVITIKYGIGGSTLGTITVPIGSTAGSVFTLSTSQALSADEIIEINSDGAGAGVVRGSFLLRFDRT